MLRIPVDFNTMQQHPDEFVYINIDLPQQRNLVHLLHPGLRVLLCDTDLEVEGVILFDYDDNKWYSDPDWSTRRDIPYP